MQKHNIHQALTLEQLYLPIMAAAIPLMLEIAVWSPLFAVPLTAIYGILFARISGRRFAPYAHAETQWLVGSISVIAYFVCTLSLLFYTYRITPLSVAAVAILGPLMLLVPLGRRTEDLPQALRPPRIAHSPAAGLQTLGIFALAISLILLMFHNRTFQSVVSPWQLMPASTFILYGALMLTTTLSFIVNPAATWRRLIPLYAVAFLTATILMPLGFGFDPFVHQATEQMLMNTGTIEPMPLYYMGYYVLVVAGAHLSRLSIVTIDSLLSISLAFLLIPLGLSAALRYLTREKRYALMAAAGFVLLPFPFLIQSTPQALSFVLGILAVCMGIIYLLTPMSAALLATASLTTLLIHPLTGVPICFATLLFVLHKNPTPSGTRVVVKMLIILLGAIAVPLLLYLAAFRSPEFAVRFTQGFDPFILFRLLPTVYPYAHLDDLIYTVSSAATMLWLMLGILGWHRSDDQTRHTLAPLFWSALMAGISAVITSSIMRFDFATSGEQYVFAERMLVMSLIFMMPAALLGLYQLIRTVARSGTSVLILGSTILALIATGAWYLSYPRFDTHEQSKGFTASRSDYTATHWINTDMGSNDAVILANQTVSAVALRQFGFLQYHQGLFYYPIPTNGDLHQLFLQAMSLDQPMEQTIEQTLARTGVDRIYIVINDYWTDAERLRQKFSLAAAAHMTFTDAGRVDVFRLQAR